METGPQLSVLSDRLVKPGIKPVTHGLQGKWFIYYTTAIPNVVVEIKIVSEYDQESPQSQTAHKAMAPPGRATQKSQATRKTS